MTNLTYTIRCWWKYDVQQWYHDALPRRIAWMLPRKVALWAFIRVYGADRKAPTTEYRDKHEAWQKGAGR